MNEHQLQINEIVQGIIKLEAGLSWFSSKEEDEQRDIMRSFSSILLQSHPRLLEIEEGIVLSKLKPTFTPCVLVSKIPFPEACSKILGLPRSEREKAFVLWLSIFKVADTRRRNTECKNGCAHEWHNINGL